MSAGSPKGSHRTAAPSLPPLRNGATVARGIGQCRAPHPRSVLSASEIGSTTRGVASCVARGASPHRSGCTARGLRTASTGRRAPSCGHRLVLIARVSVGTCIHLVHHHHLSLVACLAAALPAAASVSRAVGSGTNMKPIASLGRGFTQSSIDSQRVASDVGRRVRAQEGDGVGDLLRPTKTAQRDRLGPVS